MGFYYFAYGSNMLTKRLKRRCESAAVVGKAEAADLVLKFNKRSKDESGKANLCSALGGHRSLGVLFEIAKSDLGRLDQAEGVGSGYERNDRFAVRLVDSGALVHAKTYISPATDSRLRPYDWYLALVIAGAKEHGLGEDYVAALRRVPFETDSCLARETRRNAIEALTHAGIANFKRVLSVGS